MFYKNLTLRGNFSVFRERSPDFFPGKSSSEIRCVDPSRKKFDPSTFIFDPKSGAFGTRIFRCSVRRQIFFFVGGTFEGDQNGTSTKKKHHPTRSEGGGSFLSCLNLPRYASIYINLSRCEMTFGGNGPHITSALVKSIIDANT